MTPMTRRDIGDLLLLAALWGASFLFMRTGAADFGPLVLVFVRVAGASALLVPLLLWRGEAAALRSHWRPLALVGLINSALPFMLYAVAALVLSAGLMSVFNATTPIWGALVAWLWLGERLAASRMLGLVIGVIGVAGLAWGEVDFRPGDQGISPALGIAACVLASLLYGVAANVSRKHLAGVPPMAVAAGSQLAATLIMIVPALWSIPAVMPNAAAWASAGALALACTGLAYVLYFRLITHAGAVNAISVTLLIPPFAMFWGWLFLSEQLTGSMLLGGAVVLLGTALATGLLRRRGLASAPL